MPIIDLRGACKSLTLTKSGLVRMSDKLLNHRTLFCEFTHYTYPDSELAVLVFVFTPRYSEPRRNN